MRIPRFRVRTLMITVAVVAVTVASTIQVVRLWRLSAWYAAEANQAAFWEMTARGRAQADQWAEESHLDGLRFAREELAKPMYRGPERKEFMADPLLRLAEYHESEARGSAERAAAENRVVEYWHARRARYRRAARYPWLPVPSDPPEPK
jgi:hypothetical protein